MKKILTYIVRLALIVAFIWGIFSFIAAIVEYRVIADDIDNVEKDDIDFYETHKNQDIEMYVENTDKINMLIDVEKRQGKALKFYDNGKIKTELDCRLEPITLGKLFISKLIIKEKYNIEEVKYFCKRTQYYENGKEMLSAKYKSTFWYSYGENIYHFLKEEILHFHNDMEQLTHYGFPMKELTETSVSYYENIPNEIKNAPIGVDTCIHRGLLSGNDSLCRKEKYTKYTNNHWNVVEYFPNGRLKSDLTYKNLGTNEIIKGKIFNNNGRLSTEYVDKGNRILFYNHGKLYKEINKNGNKRENIKIYSSNGDLEYILLLKKDKPYKGFKYEKGKEIPLTNAHIYNIFKIKTNVE